MPNKILNHHHNSHTHHAKQHDGGQAQATQKPLHQIQSKNSGASLNNGKSNKSPNQNDPQNGQIEQHQQQQQQQQQHQQQSANILNVAEMILHGVADHEILDIWLRSIACQEFAKNFLDAGYDMPTISRITPQDLTAIGITDPTKRLKILSEIKKLNLQDGLPTFKPANLSHWLSLLRLDSHYHKSLCDQQIDTIEKTCQLTWEDFEDLGITRLGHQKRLLLAIEKMKELETEDAKQKSKPISEPIYDTNPSQILLVASAENHSMNGPIINKQSSTSELSSTGSGSMHSLYSANSVQYQPNYQTLPTIQQHQEHPPTQSSQQQAIYSQPPSHIMHPPHQLTNGIHRNHQPLTPQHHQSSHYQAVQPHFINPSYNVNNLNGRNSMINRQSLGQLPFSALANLPKHQQQLLQQSSIYATLSRQPPRAKQPPPPVPIRTNSLKSNSLIDQDTNNHSSSQSLTNTQANSSSSLLRSGSRLSNRNQFSSQAQLSKNKSFSGGAYMDAARARFLNRNNQLQQANNLPHHIQPMTNQGNIVNDANRNLTQNLIYGINTSLARHNGDLTNGNHMVDSDNLSLYSRQSIPSNMLLNQASTLNLRSSDASQLPAAHQSNQGHSIKPGMKSQRFTRGDDYDCYSDTNSTKSLILPATNVTNSPVNSNGQCCSSQDSSSSQTIYNSASSGSNDHNINGCSLSQSRPSTVSSSTLNDVNLILDQQVAQSQSHKRATDDHERQDRAAARLAASGSFECNATTGKDDDFPPPPSPLSLTDFDEHNLGPVSADSNFADISQGLMTFRVGT